MQWLWMMGLLCMPRRNLLGVFLFLLQIPFLLNSESWRLRSFQFLQSLSFHFFSGVGFSRFIRVAIEVALVEQIDIYMILSLVDITNNHLRLYDCKYMKVLKDHFQRDVSKRHHLFHRNNTTGSKYFHQFPKLGVGVRQVLYNALARTGLGDESIGNMS